MPLAPYYPALVILAGAIVVAIGGFWAATRPANFNARLNEKNNQIISLQDQQLKAITGGDTYPLILPALYDKATLQMRLRTEGKYPLYGLQATILDQDLFETLVASSKDKRNEIAAIHDKSQHVARVGNLGPNQGETVATYMLDPNIGHRSFLITFIARNGQVTEYLKLYWVKDWWAIAYKVFNETGVLKEQIGENFPKAIVEVRHPPWLGRQTCNARCKVFP
jgi:hypothetical protein